MMKQVSKEYETYFSDDKLTKTERKNKLIAAGNVVTAERQKMAKFEDPTYETNVLLNEPLVTEFHSKCMVRCIV